MNNVNSLEIKRKIMHILIGIIGILLLTYKIITPFFIFIWLIIGIFVSLISLKIKIPIISFFLDKFERKKDMEKFPGRGVIFAFVGSLLTLQLFETNIALASIIILTFADPISYLVGKTIGKIKSPLDNRKNIEGHIAGIIISALLAMFLVSPVLAFFGAIIAMLFESIIIEIQKIELDDNLIIPLVAGTAMFLITKLFM